MTMRSTVLAYGLLSLLAISSCGGDADEQPPVATPSVTLNKDQAAIGSPLTVTYRFEPTDRRIDGDYWVFLHVLDQEGERLWGDDHQPPVPTSTWKQGAPVEYSRTMFVPLVPYIGPAQIRLGLYMPSTGDRLTLAGTDITRREYLVGKLQLLPRSENIFLIYKDGWYPMEVHSADPTIEWQWMGKSAFLTFRNPKKDATFYLQYDSRADLFNPPQHVTVRVGDQTIGSFPSEARERTLVTLPIAAAQFGDGEMAEIVLEVDRTFQAGGGDTRQLGIRVYHAFVEPR